MGRKPHAAGRPPVEAQQAEDLPGTPYNRSRYRHRAGHPGMPAMRGSAMPKVLIVTNDFPPRAGGIQSFVHALAVRLPEGSVTVYAPAWEGAVGFDAAQPFPVERHPTSLMLPVPSVARRAARLLERDGCDTVLFGAAAPLGLLAPSLRRAGARRLVAITHGHEAGWAVLPGARSLLRRIGDSVDTVTYLGEYTRVRLARALSPAAAARMTRLAPGVDSDAFRPGAGGAAVRERLGLTGRPVVVCVSRLVPRKGQDTLIRAWPQVRAAVPDAALLLVGGGPYAGRVGQPLPLEAAMVLLPLIGVALNGTSSVLYGSVPALVTPERRARAFSIFYTGTIGSGAVAPAIYGVVGDALGQSTAVKVVAAVVLLTLPLSLVLKPVLPARP